MAELDSEHLTTRAVDLLIAGAGNAASSAHAERCALCGEKVAAARSAATAFLAANPPSVRAAQLVAEAARAAKKPTPARGMSWWQRWVIPTTALAAAAFAIVLWRPMLQGTQPDTRPEILDKGALAAITLTRQRDGGPVHLAHSGETFATGERVQLLATITAPTRVRVLALLPSGYYETVLDESLVRSGPLSRAFVLDADPADTRLVVVMDGFAEEIVLRKAPLAQ